MQKKYNNRQSIKDINLQWKLKQTLEKGIKDVNLQWKFIGFPKYALPGALILMSAGSKTLQENGLPLTGLPAQSINTL